MSGLRELTRERDIGAGGKSDLVEVMAKAAHTEFARVDRWDRVHDRIKESFRREMRAAIAAGEATGLLRIREDHYGA